MTDEWRPVDEGGAPGRGKPILGVLALIVLAVIGAGAGWVLAGDPERPVASPSPAPPPAAPTSAPPTAPTSSALPTTADARPTGTRTTTPTGLTVPELVGVDFEQARRELRDRRLGWRLVFGTAAGRAVARTSPSPGTPVKRGITVTVWVVGPAPAVAVPDVGALSCSDAADDLVDAGLYPRYATQRQGSVSAQAPTAGAMARWNDQVVLTCGTSSPVAPSPTP
ncbi:PASTA domain-containing protein [Micromonospora sp. DT31]|uniref:PASTA domain-containing protein n=1 Tax=Micromonospora sp. DT31 TaxID=3393434 RepID=UPI003CE985DE